MKFNFYISIVSLIIATSTKAQDSASVLFIGNSYTYYNNMPTMMNEIAVSLGDYLEYDSQTLGGATFSTHANNAGTYTKINSDNWDYVVMQAQSQEPSFSETQVNSQTLPFAMQVADSVYDNNFCSEVLMFMTWGRENGDPQWAPISTFEGMNTRLRNAYIRMADSVEGSVSPVGSAWRYVRDNYPGINLYAPDGSHPSLEGSYLAACTFYSSVYRKSTVGASFISTLDPVTAGVLQDVASMTVLDSLDQWNLRPVWEHTQAEFNFSVNGLNVEFDNYSTKATNFYWDFGDGQNSTQEDPTVNYAANGSYIVQLIAESPCDVDTVYYQINIGGVGLKTKTTGAILLATKGSDSYEILNVDELLEVSVFNSIGKEVYRGKTKFIDLSREPHGMYTIQISTTQEMAIKKVIKN